MGARATRWALARACDPLPKENHETQACGCDGSRRWGGRRCSGGGTGWAQQDLAPLEISPSSGPAGAVFTVSGDGCVGEAGPGDVLVTVFFTADEVVDEFGVTPEDDGTWSAEILTDEPTDLPPGVYDVTATCFVSPESEKVIVEYDFVEFELIAPPGPPPTEPPTTEPPTTPPAPPATPVTKPPTFTG
jgi:hypothetical protein